MEILFITPETVPFSTSAIARVSGVLPKALKGIGHHPIVLSPLYASIDPTAMSLARRLSGVDVEVAGRTLSCEIYDGRTSAGTDLIFLGHSELFQSIDSLDHDDEERGLRHLLFARAALQVARTREPRIDVVHGHGLSGALVAHLSKSDADNPPVVFTLNRLTGGDYPDLGWDGLLGSSSDPDWDLGVSAVEGAAQVVSVSAAAAREASQRPTPLGQALANLEGRFHGITSGVDMSTWNPTTDPLLGTRFDPMDTSGKEQCKSWLQQHLGLPLRADVPLIGAIRLSDDSTGFELLAEAGRDILRNDVQLVVQLATPGDALRQLQDLLASFPDRLQVRTDPDNQALAHQITAASDLMVIPPRQNTIEFGQMYAHRYGALPIALHQGVVADTVVDCEASLKTGSGFMFRDNTAAELLAAIQRGIAAYCSGAEFRKLQRRVMRIDHSWERSARLYERVYTAAAQPAAQATG